MQLVGTAALAVLAVLSVALYILGSRFTRAYVAKYGTMPRLTWMFRTTDDPELERPRRLALGILPIILLAMGVYLSQA